MSHGSRSISASKNDNCRGWKVFLRQAAALGKHACVTAIMAACSLPRRSPGTDMLHLPSAGSLPYVCVCVFVRACLTCVRQCIRALTHLERELSALRNVDTDQPHREWCRFKFLLRFINNPPDKNTGRHRRYTNTPKARCMHVVTYIGQLNSGMCVL